MLALTTTPGDFPAEFDWRFYTAHHDDLRGMNEAKAAAHYENHGRAEGRPGSAPAQHDDFLALVPRDRRVLEIGPFFRPLIIGPEVRYFDICDTESLKRRAAEMGGDPEGCPQIDYVSPVGDLSVVDAAFDAIFSSHCIEHQPDLVRHLSAASALLAPGGYYYLLIPDKRYCFDHFIAPSTIADVVDAHLRHRVMNEPRNILGYTLLRTHNDSLRHWAGDHGRPHMEEHAGETAASIRTAADFALGYVDTHVWQFMPETFRAITSQLVEFGLSNLAPRRIYQTAYGSCEFGAILQKV